MRLDAQSKNTPCEFAREVKTAADSQSQRAKDEPALASAYFQAGYALRKVLYQHTQRCAACQSHREAA